MAVAATKLGCGGELPPPHHALIYAFRASVRGASCRCG